ncbi:hypothetical protein Nepgr_014170 [Nepenthes gracilis]|uniref:Homeobox domain-containing protein n=1 Tax=Nepenthes gracilis TaxID=150966 RepID=A0AAD3XPW3_NEPGR|nr:hypothetical protein Nepgr_014170 [Nepenthes gracilis]
MAPAPSSRWCPTPEQLMILEEMYRGGVKTPSATQIQHITAHLSLYGKIEGKNVFYWFQNHKARDRQKLRRRLSKQLMIQHHHQQLYPINHHQHFLHHFLEPPCYIPGFHQVHHCNSAGFLSQAQLQNACCPQMVDYTWKVEIPGMKETEKSATGSYGDDRVFMTDMGSSLTCCSGRPLKTLELFPVTATGLDHKKTALLSSKSPNVSSPATN